MSFKIIGTGRSLPEQSIDNNQLADFLDTNDEWIVNRTGIRRRSICTTETVTDLAVQAAERALAKAGLDPSSLDLILCSTLGGDYATPSLACCVAQRLGAGCPALDLNAACSGFLYALDTAAAYLDSGRAEHILIVCAERMSNRVDWQDRATCVLFGDGAGACVLTKGDALRYTHLTVEGNPQPLYLPSPAGNSPFYRPAAASETEFLHMNGTSVFRFAVRVLEAEIARALQALQLAPAAVDFFLVHQANRRIISYVQEKLGLPAEKFPLNVDRYSNTSSASIPILLDELLEAGTILTGQTLLLIAFGAGLTYGACALCWE